MYKYVVGMCFHFSWVKNFRVGLLSEEEYVEFYKNWENGYQIICFISHSHKQYMRLLIAP
jgi:hypothetical protein